MVKVILFGYNYKMLAQTEVSFRVHWKPSKDATMVQEERMARPAVRRCILNIFIEENQARTIGSDRSWNISAKGNHVADLKAQFEKKGRR